MDDRSPPLPLRPSPLDPFLCPFLRQIAAIERGYAPAAQLATVAGTLGWDTAFVETLFISARARGLVEVGYERGARNRWRLSSRGSRWLSLADPEGVDGLTDDGPDPPPSLLEGLIAGTAEA